MSVNPKEVYFSSSFFSSYLFPSPISSLPLENVYFCRNFDVSEFSKTPENSETISTENIHLRIPTAFLPKSDLPFPLIFFTNKQSALMKLSKFLLRISTHPFDLVSRLDVITKSVHLINFFFFSPMNSPFLSCKLFVYNAYWFFQPSALRTQIGIKMNWRGKIGAALRVNAPDMTADCTNFVSSQAWISFGGRNFKIIRLWNSNAKSRILKWLFRLFYAIKKSGSNNTSAVTSYHVFFPPPRIIYIITAKEDG